MKKIITPDFLPAVLKENCYWYVEYYVRHPITDKLERFRTRIKKGKMTMQERRTYANYVVHQINSKLYTGWNVFLEDKQVANNFIKVVEAIEKYRENVNKKFKSKQLRYDSVRSYISQLNKLQKIILKLNPNAMVFDLI